jgi:hypothetical protein
MARFSDALASYQLAISSTVRKHPRQQPVAGSRRQIPTHGDPGAALRVMSPGDHEPLAGSKRSASLVLIWLAL